MRQAINPKLPTRPKSTEYALCSNNVSIELLRRGDRIEFSKFFAEYYDRILTYAYDLVKDETEAAAIADDSFYKFWKEKANFNTMPQSLKFLYVCTQNACMSYFRKLPRRNREEKEYADFMLSQGEADIDNRQIEAEILDCLLNCIEELPRQPRQVIKMLFLEGLSIQVIADFLAISPNTVRSHKERAIKALRSNVRRRGMLTYFVLVLDAWDRISQN
jgi:RNA polymerase sigma factor (sigma-70 family)